MLLQSVSILSQYPVTFSGGAFNGEATLLGLRDTSFLNFFTRDVGNDEKASIPNGYTPNMSWWPSVSSGGMAVYKGIDGVATFSPENRGSSSSIAGSASVSASLSSLLEAIANLSASASVSADLGAMVSLVSNITASATLSEGDLRALANIVAEISVTSLDPLSPGNLANAVWNAVAADYNVSGSTGKTLKDVKTNTGLIPALL